MAGVEISTIFTRYNVATQNETIRRSSEDSKKFRIE